MPTLTRRELARLLTQIENCDPAADAAVRAAHAQSGRAHLIGITGAPGTGKSTLVAALAKAWRARNLTVAILSIDPSSPFTGGAILGDRIRMRDLSGDSGVFIRSMASRGAGGGIAAASSDAVAALDANGFNIVVIETVGAGQSEVEVAHLAQTVIVIEAPGMGDDVQAIKAGIIEIADILVVNKADRPDVNQTVSALQAALDLAPHSGGHHAASGLASAVASSHVLDGDVWTVPVLKTVAIRGEGIGALIDKIAAHRDWLLSTGQVERRRLRRSREEVTARLRELLLRRALRALDSDEFEFLVRGVADGTMTASDAARTIAARFVDGS